MLSRYSRDLGAEKNTIFGLIVAKILARTLSQQVKGVTKKYPDEQPKEGFEVVPGFVDDVAGREEVALDSLEVERAPESGISGIGDASSRWSTYCALLTLIRHPFLAWRIVLLRTDYRYLYAHKIL